MKNILYISFCTFLLFCSVLLSYCSSPGNPPPNVVLIMADDLGYGDLACYGSAHIKTPAIDRLAAEGMSFTDYHSNGPACTPTRAALMTGKYQQRVGLEGVIYVKGNSRKTGLDSSELTIAKLFRNAGYSTGIMGKWHLGYNKEYNPCQHGFDEFYGYVSGNVDYHSHYDNAGFFDWWHNLDTIKEEGYSTDLITQHSIDFIHNNQDKPFFLYIPHEAPHVPFQGRKDSAYRFPGRTYTYLGPAEDQKAVYKEMVEVMDEGIGQVMQTLKELGLDQNTFVFFCSDNGARFGSNGVLNGDKGTVWEGGHRVPAIAWYPDIIEAGSETNELVISMDLLPTLLAMAGIKAPGIYDGIDFSHVMLRKSTLKERPLFWRYHGQLAVRKGNWKYSKIEKKEYLFNLQDDLAEENNLIEQHKEIAQEMETLLTNWENEMDVYAQKTR